MIDVRISFSAQYLGNNSMEFNQILHYTFILGKRWIGLLLVSFSQIFNRITTHDWCQNFDSAQYLENKSTEFDQILHVHLTWEDVGWDYYTFVFCKFLTEFGTWLISEFRFRSISWELQDAFWPKFEQQHDKTNKVTVRPAKTQISLGIRPVWSESSLCA